MLGPPLTTWFAGSSARGPGCWPVSSWRSRRSAWPWIATTCPTPRWCWPCCWRPGHGPGDGDRPVVAAAGRGGDGRRRLRDQDAGRVRRPAHVLSRLLVGRAHRPACALAHLTIATFVLIAASLAWPIAVQAIPKDRRPYIGGSTNNSAIELALGYNGLSRIMGMGQSGPPGPGGPFPPSPRTRRRAGPPAATRRNRPRRTIRIPGGPSPKPTDRPLRVGRMATSRPFRGAGLRGREASAVGRARCGLQAARWLG